MRSVSERCSYGAADGQQGDLHPADVAAPPVVCLLHGGFRRMPYGRDQFDVIARDLDRVCVVGHSAGSAATMSDPIVAGALSGSVAAEAAPTDRLCEPLWWIGRG